MVILYTLAELGRRKIARCALLVGCDALAKKFFGNGVHCALSLGILLPQRRVVPLFEIVDGNLRRIQNY